MSSQKYVLIYYLPIYLLYSLFISVKILKFLSISSHKKEKKKDKDREKDRDRDRREDRDRIREERERSTSKKKKSKDKERDRDRKSDSEKGDVKVCLKEFLLNLAANRYFVTRKK